MKLLSACRAARGPSPDVGSVLSKAEKDESMSLAEGWGDGQSRSSRLGGGGAIGKNGRYKGQVR